jgi:hypothetical protein
MGKIDDLFGSMSFMLPEHVQALAEYYFEKTLIPQPLLEDDEKTEINYILNASRKFDYAITVIWWRPIKDHLGRIEMAWGWLQVVDMVRRQIKLKNDEEVWWIDLDRIVRVEETALQ